MTKDQDYMSEEQRLKLEEFNDLLWEHRLAVEGSDRVRKMETRDELHRYIVDLIVKSYL